jgi:hypothetical protein
MDKPLRVSRVMPPKTTIENTHAHPPPSHHATCRTARSPPTTKGIATAVPAAVDAARLAAAVSPPRAPRRRVVVHAPTSRVARPARAASFPPPTPIDANVRPIGALTARPTPHALPRTAHGDVPVIVIIGPSARVAVVAVVVTVVAFASPTRALALATVRPSARASALARILDTPTDAQCGRSLGPE